MKLNNFLSVINKNLKLEFGVGKGAFNNCSDGKCREVDRQISDCKLTINQHLEQGNNIQSGPVW